MCPSCYPRIHDRRIPAGEWLADYVTTYVQRDVRQVLNVSDLAAFTQFVRLCAGRTASEINLSSLGGDAGISHNTARAWLSVLETSFLCFRAPAWRTNMRKQEVKAPKLHFFDSGLACSLLGIASADQLRRLLIYGGESASRRSGIHIVPWSEIQALRWAPDAASGP